MQFDPGLEYCKADHSIKHASVTEVPSQPIASAVHNQTSTSVPTTQSITSASQNTGNYVQPPSRQILCSALTDGPYSFI